MQGKKARQYGVWLVVGWLLLWAMPVTAQMPRPFYCRTTEVRLQKLKELGIDLQVLHEHLKNLPRQRQAGSELPSLLLGGLGSGLYPQGGLVGTVRALHLMVRPAHPDIVPDPKHTTSFYNKLLFDESDPDSLASFFRETSYGRFRLVGDSYGWLTVAVPTATSGAITFAPDWEATLQPALNQLARVVDFSRYDSDRDGTLDFVMVTVASDPDTRPPSGNPFADPSFGAFTAPIGLIRKLSGQPVPPLATVPGGLVVDCAFFVHETLSVLPGHGVYAHEGGHSFGMPDLYNPYGLQVDPGGWATMATGERYEAPGKPLNPFRPGGFPVHYDPWNKMIWGWLSPIEVTRNLGTVTIPPYSEQPVVYRLWAFGSSAQDEYFLVVNRQRRGFDRFLPTGGLNIFHIDRALLSDPVLNLFNAVQFQDLLGHRAIDLVDADGRTDMEDPVPLVQAFDWTSFGFGGWQRGNWGDDGDAFPGKAANTKFDFLTNPSSATFFGVDSGVQVLDIKPLPDGTVQATLRVAVQPQAVILSPRDGERVFSTRPTLQVQFTAPLGAPPDIDPTTITVSVDGATMPIPNPAAVFNEARQVMSLPLVDPTDPTRPLSSGSHTVEIKAINRAGRAISPVSGKFTITNLQLRFNAAANGLTMLSLPYDFTKLGTQGTPAFVLGIPDVRIARFGILNPLGKIYDYHFSGEFVERFVPGRAYWVRLTGDALLVIEASDVDRTQPFRIANEPVWDLNELDVGWQQIGNPFPFAVDASAVQILLPDGKTLSLQEAIQRQVILNLAYQFTGDLNAPYAAMDLSDWTMQPFTGYWVFKFQPCSFVVVPSPSSRKRQRIAKGEGRTVAALEIWGDEAELPYRLAVNNGGEPLPAPPAAPGMTAWAGFVGDGRSGLPLMEIPASKFARWQLVVHSSKPNSPVTLRWRTNGGKATQLLLTDPQTHRTVALIGNGEFTFKTDDQRKRALLLQVRSLTDLPLRIVEVKVTRLLGRGFIVQGRLTIPAKVQGEIRTLTGRLVRTLPSSDEPGSSIRLFWDGRSADGKVLPKTVLLLHLKAFDLWGRETQRVVVLR